MMKAVAERVDSLAAVGLMDLSVEAECFGAKIRCQKDMMFRRCASRF